MSSLTSDLSYGLQLDPRTAAALSHFARRRRVLLLLRSVAAGIVFFVAAMGLVAICDFLWLLSDGVRWLLSFGGYAVTVGAIWWFGFRHFGEQDPRQIARQLESADPRLREDLLSAVELADPGSANGSEGFRLWLQRRVARRAEMLDVGRLLPVGLVQRWLITGTVITLVCLSLLMIPRMQFGRRIARAMLPGIAIQRASLTEVKILKPSPPSGYVAEGDAVGVVARVNGAAVKDVVMQWKTGDGVEGESLMSPRVAPATSASDGTLPHEDIYAANLSVGKSVVEYRVIAGDAVTLWYELMPLPRPRVESFKKRYEFPSYAKLAERVEEAEHGDLKALVGTLAEVTVRFDEPVSSATLRFGNRGVTFNLDPVAGSDRDYVVTIPIRTPANYQVDAISMRSGLNNPFSPQYSITPVIDTPPVVNWVNTLPRTLIVSPLDVVSLGATVIDDLPMDKVVQEFQVNGDPVIRRNVPLGESARELNLQWDWDLLRRIDGEEQSIKLDGGDVVRTRVVGIDRNSQRGESDFIELLIAEEGFDSDRHRRLEELSGVTYELAEWASRARQLLEGVKEIAEKGRVEEFELTRENAAKLRQEKESIAKRLQHAVETSNSPPETSTLELAGRALLDFDQKLGNWFGTVQDAMGDDHPSWQTTREKTLRELAGASGALVQEASRIEQYARAIFGEELTVAVVGDAMSLQRSLRPLVDQKTQLPADRFARYLNLAIGRMKAIDELIEQHGKSLPESTVRHLENWHRWTDSWSERLRASIDEPPREDAHRALVAQFDAELRNQVNHGMIDGRLASTLTNMSREIRQQIGATSDRVRQAAAFGDSAAKWLDQAEKGGNSDEVARANRDAQFAQTRFASTRDQLLERLAGEESLHRARPSVDLQYAADMKLMHRAIENVTQQGYAPYHDEPAASVHQNLAKAFQIIEAKHEADMWLEELRTLMLAERRLDETAVEKIKHATWIERFTLGLEWPVRTLQNAGIDWQEIEGIERSRYNDDFNQARTRITSRRWSVDEMLTAEAPLDALQAELSASLAKLEPRVIASREIIRKYVLTLPEQAREAAEKAKQAQERTEARPDSERETARELDEQQQAAEDAARETLESLVDLANTSSLTDAEQRELARDADAAAAQIQDAKDRAEQEMEKANEASSQQDRSEALDQTAKALEDLSKALEQTADHFERANRGEDLAESREQLRQAQAALELQQELQEQYDRAEAMANAAESSPQELMDRLERELQRNEPMQQELSEIAERAAEAAQRTLEQAAKDETALNQSLERSDPTFQEQKRRAARQLATLARRAATVDSSLMNAADRAIASANVPESRPKLSEAREQLRDAVQQANQMGGEQALLSKMQETAAEMARAIQSAKETLADAQQQTEQAQDDNLHKDQPSRQRAMDQMENVARSARTQQAKDVGNEKRQWAAAEKEAGTRIQQAQRQKRDAENSKRQVEDRIKRDAKIAESLKPQLAEIQRRVEEAVAAEQAAKETKDFAEKNEKEAARRESELKNKKIGKLEQPNPAAQLASQMTAEANEELSAIQNALKELAKQTSFGDQLRVPEPQAQQFANQQQRVQQDVSDAAEQLRRAARHEQRLGQQQLAEQLDAAADAVSDNAASAAAQATEALRQAAENAQQTPEANRRVAEATEQISEAARQLADLLASATPPDNAQAVASQSSESSPTEERAQQLAQTLDELDRAMSQPQGQQDGDASQQGQPQEGQQGQPQQGQPQQDQPQQGQQGQPQTASEASPTLAGAMDAQAQQAARQRNEQINPGSQQGQPSNQGQQSPQGATESGSGEMPGGGFVDSIGVDRLGSQWGQLRERRTDDAAESRSATISPQYRREIEAYFRAIAKRAAEKPQ